METQKEINKLNDNNSQEIEARKINQTALGKIKNCVNAEKFTKLVATPLTKYFYPQSIKPRDSFTFKNIALSTESHDASKIAYEILKKGGNAADAAVGATLAVGAVHNFSSGLGGGGFALITRGKEVEAIDFKTRAPKNVSPDMFKGYYADSMLGIKSICIPGEVMGLSEIHRKYGKLPWKEVVMPVANLARSGFIVSPSLERKIKYVQKELSYSPFLSSLYMKGGEPLKAGSFLKLEALGNTLEKIALEGSDCFYKGDIMKSMIKSLEGPGIISENDFQDYKTTQGKIVKGMYKGKEVISIGAPASGAILIYGLQVLDGYDLKSMETSKANHIIIETLKHMYARRIMLGDPDNDPKYFESFEKRILSVDSAIETRKAIDESTTKPKEAYSFDSGSFKLLEDHGTIHISTLDSNGLSVSLTSSLNLEFGSKYVDDSTGIIFNNDMNDFAVDNSSNYFGLIPGPYNKIVPNRRSASSSVPVIVRDPESGKVLLVSGASGGTRIISVTLQSIINVFDYKMRSKDAISQPRLHHQLYPNHIELEHGTRQELVEELQKKGHKVHILPPNTTMSSVHLLRVDVNNGSIDAASDVRKNGTVIGT